MRLWMSVACIAFLLSGCQHYTMLSQNDFRQGNAPDFQFARDNYDCQSKAVVRQNLVGGGDPRGTYNDAYVGCMKERGYQPSNIDLLGINGQPD